MDAKDSPTQPTYYGECLDAVPFGSMVNFLSQQLPRPIAWTFVACWRVKSFFGGGILPNSGFGPVGSSTVLARADMPARPMSRWAARLEDLSDLGFTPLRFSVGDHIGAKESASVLLFDGDGTTFALLEWFQMPGTSGIEERNLLELNSLVADPSGVAGSCGAGNVSPYQDFTEVMTAVTPRENLPLADIFAPQFVDAAFLADSIPVKRVVKQHLHRLEGRQLETVRRENALKRYDALSQGRFDWMMDRGLIRKLTPKEVEKIRQIHLPQT
ncbi:hypothetical protein [Neorhodopirellula pilleata]|uniref:Uncharacterized protein n=1 Tax=Neorhodopirellula pilleata TaxID=2714738 RepID=A0A5C6AWY0_9BACT|nr:hypothetical protein [Neorhodopirellula pilleata]TWU04017.1 hypothetical protein Pla100_09530 [Neorhodopirellula pilleata]